MGISYHTDLDPKYGEAVDVTPLLRRVVANNPGRFTFMGSGTYIVGRGRVAVIDPGPKKAEHTDAILAALDGEEISHILVTHTHIDHCPGAHALKEATGAPLYGFGPHPSPDRADLARVKPTTWDSIMPTAEEIEELTKSMEANRDEHDAQDEPGDLSFSPDHDVAHGDVIEGDGWTFDALHTPGHISNHLCFALREEHALFTGDHVMGWSTSVVPPPDGSMRDYMRSLRLLLDRDDRTYYPTHGPPVPDGPAFTRSLIEHRENRERQILEVLRRGPATIPEMVTAMYQDVPHILWMAAGQSVLSHLFHMVESGQVATEGEPTADSLYRLA